MDNENLILPDPRPSRADAIKNRERLLETAQRLFAEQGVEAVSMTAIAQAAGVGKGTLYRHFENKIELYLALLDKTDRDLQNRTLERLRKNPEPLGNLRWFLHELVFYVLESDELLCAGSGAGTPPLDHPVRLWWRQTIRGLLEQLEIPGDLDYITDVFYVMVDVRTSRFQRHSLGYNTDRILDGLDSLLLQFTL